jgi:superfamily II DNA or RNA helicase
MSSDPKGRELFIVDNSISGWTGLRYLDEWTGIAKQFDIATGYFELGSLLALGDSWKQLGKIRILLGAEMSMRTRRAMLDAVRTRALRAIDDGLEEDKRKAPLLDGVPAIVDAMTTRQIECRVYDKDKFHAKAYITHGKLDVIGAQALVGSSNFTRPGLTENIELNIQVQSSREVAQLQEWFEEHWKLGTDVTEDLVETVKRHIHPYTPFEVYAKALQEFFRGHELTASEWDETQSKMFPVLDRYQQEAYWALMKIARQHGGAFLCDGVGLGKTFVGLMLIERLVLHEGKRVVLFAPKGARESVWEPHLKTWLSHIGGGADFSNLAVFNHTDLNREGEYPERFRRIAELADAVVIDEAHHFRNPGRHGNEALGVAPSRYQRLFELLDNTVRPKTLYMLTATPINNRLSDFRHMTELFTRRDESHFARTLGINNLTAYFNNMEKQLRKSVDIDGDDVSEHVVEAQSLLTSDLAFDQLIVQRSRSYAKESQIRETGNAAAFPNRNPPQVADYSIRKSYGRLLELFEKAFERQSPLFTLSIYYPLHWYIGPDTSIDPLVQGRQQQVVSLIRTQFLKRFESSVSAFGISLHRLLVKLLAFVEVHSTSEGEKGRLERWKIRHEEVLGWQSQQGLWEDDEEEADEDIVPEEFLDAVTRLDPTDYNVSEMIQETFQDLDQIVVFLEEVSKFEARHDDKLQRLIGLLRSAELVDKKVLIFTEFADTARYLRSELTKAGIRGVSEVDSATKGSRADVIRRFAPYYNGSSATSLAANGQEEIRVLISTDVLSEGLNLQDATRMINYDIHWNPVRLMQRIGRVDRRLNPKVEAQMVSDHPELESSRGVVSFWNFLPPDDLNRLLTLFTRVTQKTLLISKTMGIEGKQLLTPDDDYEALREFNHAYEGTKTAVEEMHLEYQAMLQRDPELEGRLHLLPGAVLTGRERASDGARGVFFCYALPALDKEEGEFTEAAGTTRWYLYDLDQESILEEPADIVGSIRSMPETPRKATSPAPILLDVRTKVEKHITNSYLKRVDAPVGVGPTLRCWMELMGA